MTESNTTQSAYTKYRLPAFSPFKIVQKSVNIILSDAFMCRILINGKVLQMGRKHCGKRRNCLLQAISPFPTVFSEALYCGHIKARACLKQGEKNCRKTNNAL